MADALGATGVTVRTVGDLDIAVRAIEHRDRPILVDVDLDPAALPVGGH